MSRITRAPTKVEDKRTTFGASGFKLTLAAGFLLKTFMLDGTLQCRFMLWIYYAR
jgi:hypothetical protein